MKIYSHQIIRLQLCGRYQLPAQDSSRIKDQKLIINVCSYKEITHMLILHNTFKHVWHRTKKKAYIKVPNTSIFFIININYTQNT